MIRLIKVISGPLITERGCRSVVTQIYGSCVWLVCSGLRKYALKTLFSYKGWMIEARGISHYIDVY